MAHGVYTRAMQGRSTVSSAVWRRPQFVWKRKTMHRALLGLILAEILQVK